MSEHNNQPDDSDRRDIDKKRFRLDAGINIAHILTTLGMVFALFNWGSNVNSAQAVQQSQIQTLKESMLLYRAETLMSLSTINQKLDDLSARRK